MYLGALCFHPTINFHFYLSLNGICRAFLLLAGTAVAFLPFALRLCPIPHRSSLLSGMDVWLGSVALREDGAGRLVRDKEEQIQEGERPEKAEFSFKPFPAAP